MDKKLMSVEELAAYLGVTGRTVYNWIKDERIPYKRAGRQYRFDTERVEEWLSGEGKGKYASKLVRVRDEKDPLTKRLLFMGLLTTELAKENVQPIVVGGNAVEFYTGGGYATADIDIAAPSEPVDRVLSGWGFEREGRYWINDSLGVLIEAPAYSLNDSEKLSRIYTVNIENYKVYIIGIEDLIIDRLSALVFWKSEDDGLWAQELLVLYRDEIELGYLKKQAAAEKVTTALNKLLKKVF